MKSAYGQLEIGQVSDDGDCSGFWGGGDGLRVKGACSCFGLGALAWLICVRHVCRC